MNKSNFWNSSPLLNTTLQGRIPALKNRIADRLRILEEGILLRKEKGFDAARQNVLMGHGKAEMDELRKQIDEMVKIEAKIREAASESSTRTYQVTLSSSLIADGFALVMVAGIGFARRGEVIESIRKQAGHRFSRCLDQVLGEP
jgi:CHASE3 domain sensor protein